MKEISLKNLDQIWDIGEFAKPAKKILRLIFVKMRHKIIIEKCDLKINYKTSDPQGTGVLYGTIWGIYESLRPFASHYFKIKDTTLDLSGSVGKNEVNFDIEGIIRIKLGHIVRAALHGGLIYFEIKRIMKKYKKQNLAA